MRSLWSAYGLFISFCMDSCLRSPASDAVCVFVLMCVSESCVQTAVFVSVGPGSDASVTVVGSEAAAAAGAEGSRTLRLRLESSAAQ